MPAEAGISYLFKLDTFISYDKDTIFHRMKIKILFVCHGNICRSPMAEFVMKKMVRDLPATLPAELQQGAAQFQLKDVEFEIASAATSTEEIGNPVYPPARRMLAMHGIDCSGKTARQMTARDYEYYDYIVLMDRNNLRNLRWILPADVYARETGGAGSPTNNLTHCPAKNSTNHKVSLLMDWVGECRDVADPWYTGDFQATWDDVNAGCRAMLSKIFVSCQEA
jgi:protein-tyrosine phosphatase